MSELPNSLLAADEPAPVTVHNENGPSPFLIVADHAGNSIPRAFGRLGLPESECEAHIAWDIGIAAAAPSRRFRHASPRGRARPTCRWRRRSSTTELSPDAVR